MLSGASQRLGPGSAPLEFSLRIRLPLMVQRSASPVAISAVGALGPDRLRSRLSETISEALVSAPSTAARLARISRAAVPLTVTGAGSLWLPTTKRAAGP